MNRITLIFSCCSLVSCTFAQITGLSKLAVPVRIRGRLKASFISVTCCCKYEMQKGLIIWHCTLTVIWYSSFLAPSKWFLCLYFVAGGMERNKLFLSLPWFSCYRKKLKKKSKSFKNSVIMYYIEPCEIPIFIGKNSSNISNFIWSNLLDVSW